MLASALLLTAGRAVVVYALLLAIVRLLGKREIGAFSPFDFLIAIVLGQIVVEIIYGNVSMLQGTVAALTICAAQYLTGWLSYRSDRLDKILNGRPTILIQNGEIRPAAMRRERVNKEELMEQLRLQGIDDIREVRFAIVEVSGQISVVRENWAEPVRKYDIDPEASRERLASLREGETPPPYKDTCSPDSLPAERI